MFYCKATRETRVGNVSTRVRTFRIFLFPVFDRSNHINSTHTRRRIQTGRHMS